MTAIRVIEISSPGANYFSTSRMPFYWKTRLLIMMEKNIPYNQATIHVSNKDILDILWSAVLLLSSSSSLSSRTPSSGIAIMNRKFFRSPLRKPQSRDFFCPPLQALKNLTSAPPSQADKKSLQFQYCCTYLAITLILISERLKGTLMQIWKSPYMF